MIPAIFAKAAATAAAMPFLRTVISAVSNRAVNQKADSLIKFTKATRVEPIAIVDERMAGRESTPLILNTLSALFTAYYLQAVSLLVNVGRVNTLKLLDSLNPERDVSGAAGAYLADSISGQNTSHEAFQFGLPGMNPKGYTGYSAEAFGVDPRLPTLGAPKAGSTGIKFENNIQDNIKEAPNLSVGRVVEVTIEDGERKAVFPVLIRLAVRLVSGGVLTHILSDGSRDTSARERFHQWKSDGGGLSNFLRDVVMATDLIDEHRDALMRDTTSTYADILERRRGNFYASQLAKTPSIGNVANLVVLSSQTAKEIETKIGARLDNFEARQRLFKSSYILIMAVHDDWDRVTIYHRDIKSPSQLSAKELKVSSKGNGLDVAEILKAYQLGNRPPI